MSKWYLHFAFLAALIITGCGQEGDKPSQEQSTHERSHRTRASQAAAPREHGKAPLPHEWPPQSRPRDARAGDYFLDVSDRSQLRYAYQDGSRAGAYTILEVMGGGAGLFDFDNDGQLDVFVTGGGSFTTNPLEVHGRSSFLGRQTESLTWNDATAPANLSAASLYTHGCAIADFDNDGFSDLLVAGFGGCHLFHNTGDGGFQEVAEKSGIVCPNWNVCGAWGDINNDGNLDLFVITYSKWAPSCDKPCRNHWNLRDICAPAEYEGELDLLFKSSGNSAFEDVSVGAGISVPGRGLGIVSSDLDDDGWLDFFITNDLEENVLWYGGPDSKFHSGGLAAGVAVSPLGDREGSMGLDMGDIDGDGLSDLIYTNFTNQDTSVLRRSEPRTYINRTKSLGLAGTMSPWVGFGVNLADFDNDGWLDFFIANGNVIYGRPGSDFYQPAQLFRNHEGLRFEEVSELGGPYFSVNHVGRGTAVGDLDNDGSVDLVVVHQNDPISVLVNQHDARNWAGVALHGTISNRTAIGAKLEIQTGSRRLTRWIYGGGSYLSQSDQRVLFPVVPGETAIVTVRWPTGVSEVFSSLAPGQVNHLIEGAGTLP